MEKLHVCIVVPFFHAFWRHRKIAATAKAQLVHFDAHPDLSIPSTTKFSNCTEDWQKPDSLYDILAEEGGIAEFILPMCTTGLLDRVVWQRSPWSHQLADGQVKFVLKDLMVDRGSAQRSKKSKTEVPSSALEPVVSLRAPYYIDEGVYACKTCFDNSETSHTSTIDITTSLCSATQYRSRNYWILDICLDYFSTHNPFLVDLIASVERDVMGLSNTLKAELEAVLSAHSCGDGATASSTTAIIKLAFQHLAYRCGTNACLEYIKEFDDTEVCECAALKKARLHAVDVITRLLQCDVVPPNLKAEYLRLFYRTNTPHGEAFLSLLRFLSSESRGIIAKTQTLLLLPHHRSSTAEMETLLQDMEAWLRKGLAEGGTRPLFVTIARSAEDNYTPGPQVDWIQGRVLDILRSVYDGRDGGESDLVIHDMCEDAHDKCSTLFRMKRHLVSDHLPARK